MAVTSPITDFDGAGGVCAAASARGTKIAQSFTNILGDEEVRRVTEDVSRNVN